MKLRHVVAVGLFSVAVFLVDAPTQANVKRTVYIETGLPEDIARPGELIYDDEPAAEVCQTKSCKWSWQSRKHKPVKKLLSKLRGK